jgi:hypothetical protein
VIGSNIIVLPFTVIYGIFSSCHNNNFYIILSPNALASNLLTGFIPSEIGLITSLIEFFLGK